MSAPGRATVTITTALKAPFHYRTALVRGLSPLFASAALRSAPAPIDQSRAAAQHDAYVTALKSVVPHVVELPPADGCADSVFIEDTAVCVGDTALLTRPGAVSRQGETEAVGVALAGLGLRVVLPPPGALIDGGDVLFTGAELFVGLSRRTNEAGVAALRSTFAPLPVTAVTMPAEGGAQPLHLKSLLSMAAPGVLAAADTPAGRAAAGTLQAAAVQPLSVAYLPDAEAANAVLVNGHLLVRGDYPSSVAALRATLGAGGPAFVAVDTSEMAKADGALTCCSILLH